MKPESFEDLKKEGDRLRKIANKFERVIKLLVAAGLVSAEKVKQAEELADLP